MNDCGTVATDGPLLVLAGALTDRIDYSFSSIIIKPQLGDHIYNYLSPRTGQ